MKLHKWESLMVNGVWSWSRLKVPGGWIYQQTQNQNLVFVPEPRKPCRKK